MAQRMIDLGDARIAVTVTGRSTAPSVVLCDSSGGDGSQWQQVVNLLGDLSCLTYARPGIGDSDPLPPAQAMIPRPAHWHAEQLRSLLAAVDIPAPYVLAGCSMGGFITDAFASLYPELTAGIVQVDASPLTAIPFDTPHTVIDEADGRGALISWADTWTQAARIRPRPGLPTVVLSRDAATFTDEVVARHWAPLTTQEAAVVWANRQQQWAHRLNAAHLVADGSGHHINIDRPQLVALAIRAVITAVHTSTPLALDLDTVRAAAGHPVEPS